MHITYKRTSLPNLHPGEVGYKLSDGSYAAVKFEPGTDRAPDMFAWQARVRAVTVAGEPIMDCEDAPISVRAHMSCPKLSLAHGKVDSEVLKTAALDAAINGPDGLIAEVAAQLAYSR